MADKPSFKELTREFHYLEEELHRSTNWLCRANLITEMARVIRRLESITNLELNSIMDEAQAKQNGSAGEAEVAALGSSVW